MSCQAGADLGLAVYLVKWGYGDAGPHGRD